MNWTPGLNAKILAVPLLFLAFTGGLLDIVSGIEGFFQAIADFFVAIGRAIGSLFSQGGQAVSRDAPQVYSTTVQLVSDAKSYITASISHTFQFANPVQSVNVSLTMFNVANMHFTSLEVTFIVQGRSITIPAANMFTGPDITVDSGPIVLPTPLSGVVGVTAEITGTLCGSSCSNLTFTPAAQLAVSTPSEA